MTNYLSRNNLKEKVFILALKWGGHGSRSVGWVAAHAVPAIRKKPTNKKWG